MRRTIQNVATLRISDSMRTRWRPLLAMLIGGVGVAHVTYHLGYTLDDAYITFRYARNLTRGLGLVYNPGEYVKGYSNTFYTFLITIPELLHLDPIYSAKAVGLLSYVGLCVLGYRAYAGDLSPEVRDRGLWILLLFAVSTPMAVHYANGMETGL